MGNVIADLVEQFGYAGIALLMFLENLFPPLPSEVIMPLAGNAAGQGELSLAGILIAGTAGTLCGALFWYGLARWLGEDRMRRWADRHGRWVTLSVDEIDRIDDMFCRHGSWMVPVAHLIPGIRTLISIPAGLFAMPPWRFVLLTVIGAGVWNCALGGAGYILGSKFDVVDRYIGHVGTAIMAVLAVYYVWRVIRFKPKGVAEGRA